MPSLRGKEGRARSFELLLLQEFTIAFFLWTYKRFNSILLRLGRCRWSTGVSLAGSDQEKEG